jgi:glycosyltransferase involved in cell wall biosynthesis
LQLSAHAFWFLFGADDSSEKRKGFGSLLDALSFAMQNECIPQTSREGARMFRELWRISRRRPAGISPTVDELWAYRVRSKLAQLYAAADTLLLPSLEENLPNVMIESMCCGTPVLAFNTGGFPDAVKDGVRGKLLPTGDTRAFGKAIVELSQQPDHCAELARNCRGEMAARYSLCLQAEMLRETVSERPRKTKDLLMGPS